MITIRRALDDKKVLLEEIMSGTCFYYQHTYLIKIDIQPSGIINAISILDGSRWLLFDYEKVTLCDIEIGFC
jgi:hypothetical protein